jgi:hypothetical protein
MESELGARTRQESKQAKAIVAVSDRKGRQKDIAYAATTKRSLQEQEPNQSKHRSKKWES